MTNSNIKTYRTRSFAVNSSLCMIWDEDMKKSGSVSNSRTASKNVYSFPHKIRNCFVYANSKNAKNPTESATCKQTNRAHHINKDATTAHGMICLHTHKPSMFCIGNYCFTCLHSTARNERIKAIISHDDRKINFLLLRWFSPNTAGIV